MTVTLKRFNKTTAVAAVVGAVLLTGCSLPRDPAMQQKVDQMTPCEKIDGLINAYNTNFDALKSVSLSERFLDIWAAKVDAVGSGCQIWRAGNNTTYMCTRNAPNETVAMGWFDEALSKMGQCVSDWEKEIMAREDDGGKGVVWTKAGKFPAISAQVFPVRGRQWTLYLFVGDRDNWY